ncbi:troponin T, fast skeletal muscle isoform X8 [Artibeus jamaicensis]|uniref:troponin T, fast skeletal muscle isoform X8 n=1 Tax=Artibeus jamaicensis TaxID=9417 RepID=UPI00235B2632|nr:troponin T, fast skeletal muscle isoform X8 [Artibeus jamaicensis]
MQMTRERPSQTRARGQRRPTEGSGAFRNAQGCEGCLKAGAEGAGLCCPEHPGPEAPRSDPGPSPGRPSGCGLSCRHLNRRRPRESPPPCQTRKWTRQRVSVEATPSLLSAPPGGSRPTEDSVALLGEPWLEAPALPRLVGTSAAPPLKTGRPCLLLCPRPARSRRSHQNPALRVSSLHCGSVGVAWPQRPLGTPTTVWHPPPQDRGSWGLRHPQKASVGAPSAASSGPAPLQASPGAAALTHSHPLFFPKQSSTRRKRRPRRKPTKLMNQRKSRKETRRRRRERTRKRRSPDPNSLLLRSRKGKK